MTASSEAKEITIVREFAAPRELLWKVWTEPHHIEKWWGQKVLTRVSRKLNSASVDDSFT